VNTPKKRMHTTKINPMGYLAQTTQIASPNFDARPDDCNIDIIVIHNISLPPNQYGGKGIVQLFTNQLNPAEHPYYAEIYTRKVSAHFLIRRDGETIQFVSCLARAWHAGVSTWQGRERCNDFSIGIELEGSDFEAFEPKQYLALISLVNALKQTYPIQHIVGHADIAPGRKTDPGPYFDWNQLESVKI
jgi:N-acetyl-anhydromuramoyl-L-alanine amidase